MRHLYDKQTVEERAVVRVRAPYSNNFDDQFSVHDDRWNEHGADQREDYFTTEHPGGYSDMMAMTRRYVC